MKRRRPHVERRLPLVHQLWSEGKNDREIAEALGLSTSCVSYYRAELELPPRSCPRIPDDTLATIRRLHARGWSDRAIARRLGCAPGRVWGARTRRLRLAAQGRASKLRGARLERLRRLYDEGLHDGAIAARAGVCRKTVQLWRKRHDLPPHGVTPRIRAVLRERAVAYHRDECHPWATHCRLLAARLGWPGENFTPAAILALLEDGPRTLKQIGWLYRRTQARFGKRETTSGGHLRGQLARLHARGLVERFDHHPRLYALSDAAMARIHARCRKVGRR